LRRAELEGLARRYNENTMDFIERLFGISPDGGSGTLEAVYWLAVVTTISAAGLWRQLRGRTATIKTIKRSR
jgi:hypothetical protein